MDTKKFVSIRQKKWLEMMKNKKFDCVRMKWDIQQELSRELASVSEEEAHEIQMTRVAQNPILGPFYEKVRSVKKPQRP